MTKNLLTIAELFEGRILVVPEYQRGYAWEEPQLRDFLEDLEILRPGRSHYTGTVVLHETPDRKMDEEGKQHAVHHVVDGQQRLTTITILLAAIRRELAELEGESSAMCEGIRKSFLWVQPRKSAARVHKLQLHGELADFFAQQVLEDSPAGDAPAVRAAARLAYAKGRFREHLRSRRAELGEEYEAWLESLYAKVTQQLKVTLFPVESETEVGVIFEVMNNRGKPLSELEKVKNYLLYFAGKLEAGEDLAATVNKTWGKLLRHLMAAGLARPEDEDQLLRVHWLVTCDPKDKDWEQSRSIKNRFDVRKLAEDPEAAEMDAREYLEGLEAAALAFRDLEAPWRDGAFGGITSDPELRRKIALWSERLHRINRVAPFRPLLTAARLRGSSAEEYLRVVEACERYAFVVYHIAGARPHAGRTSLFRLAHDHHRKIVDVDRVVELLGEWTAYYCRHAHYDRFWKLDEEDPQDFYSWSGCRYLLYEWEMHLAGNRQVFLSWRKLHAKQPKTTIEHVLPQTATDAYWTERFDESARAHYTHDLGNLCLTEDNSSYGNKPFPDKRGEAGLAGRSYATSHLFSEQRLAKWKDWSPQAIQERRTEIVKWARARWPHPGDAASVDADALADEMEDAAAEQ